MGKDISLLGVNGSWRSDVFRGGKKEQEILESTTEESVILL